MRTWIASSCTILIALIMPPNRVMGQTEKPWQFPEALRSELDTRLLTFTEAQANGDWNTVDQMLGRYRRGGNYLEFTPSHRACLIDEMRRYPMVRFKYTVWDKSFSSEILSTPSERRWWTLVGEATFRQNEKEVKSQIRLIAYERLRGRSIRKIFGPGAKGKKVV